MAEKPEKLNERYKLLEKIASGGMADVYLAEEQGAQSSVKYVAIKKILTNYSSNPDYKKMFIDEGIIGCQLTHANICQVSPLLEIKPNLYIPMEFIPGKNLRQVINKFKKMNGIKPMPVPFALFVINEVLKGLDYAHTKIDERDGKHLNIVHRDMSPQNIMLSYQGSVKIIDFGIVKSKIASNETRAGVIKGKYSYMSPEQALGESLGPQSDIFSTGIVLWELLTGERLFQAESDMATLKSIQDCDLRNLEPIKKNPQVTPEVNRVVMKSLTKDRSLRYKSAELMQQDIQKYINESFSAYSSKDVRKFLEQFFSEEIVAEKKRAKELSNAQLTYSQQRSMPANKELSQLERALEGGDTNTEISESGGVTESELEPAAGNFSPTSQNQGNNEKFDQDLEDISQKTAISIDQQNFRVPSMVPKKNIETRVESSMTQEGAQVETGMKWEANSEQSLEKTTHQQGKTGTKDNNNGIILEKVEINTRSSGSSLNSIGPISSKVTYNKPDSTNFTQGEGAQSEVDIQLDQSTSDQKGNSSYFGGKTPTRQSTSRVGQTGIIVLTLGAVVLTGYLYRLVFTGQAIFKGAVPRGPTTSPTVPVAGINKPVENYQCEIQVETDPPGATIVGDDFTGSSSTGTISAPCGRTVVLRLQKPDYETVKLPVNLGNKVRIVIPRLNLQPLKQGYVTLTVDTFARVEIDGVPFGEIKANTPTEFRVTPGTHKFVFKNDAFGLRAEQQIQIQDKERKVENSTIKLSDLKPDKN